MKEDEPMMLLSDPRGRAESKGRLLEQQQEPCLEMFARRAAGVSKPTSGLYGVASLTSLTLAGTHVVATSDDLGGFPGGGKPTHRPER